ncbi:TPA: hypothetical protein NGT52_004698 [Vibrio parahaemolyticus]|nr:hypothetical protein [Vibrio parahaemolyticus]ELB2245054.1 hypothetical protein [Vibrio parahaemolyticus]MBM5101229.1 hypothetical protein [Vibrio parahaemolyticus]MBM5105873.1 hypothetical protein [Vibrio parahaemolyticus]MDF5473712.1 hypothetical protein [Vibrio parahaemolyticus]
MMTTIRSFGEKGTFSKSDWLSESRTQLRSAEMLRLIASEKLKELGLLQEKYKGRRVPSNEVTALLNDRHSANKTSFLLLGYAFELLLKSGILSIYVGLPKSLFEKDIKSKYGHNLSLMAKDLSVDLSKGDKHLLSELKKDILFKARYPTSSNDIDSYYRDSNWATSKFNDDDIFTKYLKLYHKMEIRIKKIDSSSKDPKVSFEYGIDDGYFIYRQGGTLPTMMIYKYSSKQTNSGKDQAHELKALLDSVDHRAFNYYLNRDWVSAKHLLHKVDEDKESLRKVSVNKT